MKKFVFILSFFLLTNLVYSQTIEQRMNHFNIEDDHVALSGYDPLTYFINKPHKGSKEFAYTYKGVTYYFISEKSKQVFIKNPDKYEPQYGGWCAYAITKDNPELMEVDPENYKITDGKLYLFYDSWGFNLKKKWNKDEKNLQNKADQVWRKMIQE